MATSAGQVVVSFSKEELDLLKRIELLAKLSTGGNRSAAAKLLWRAAFKDPAAVAMVDALLTMEQMRDFLQALDLGASDIVPA